MSDSAASPASSFSSSSTTTTVSETTAEGTNSTTVKTSADTTHPTPVTEVTSTSQPALSFNNPFALSSPAASSSLFASPTSAASSVADGSSSSGDAEVAPEEESTATYTPVVKLQEVAIVTGEEGDDVLYTQRAALYRFDSSAKEWKERGKGDVKFLQNKESHKVRILLRQEKTLKLCLNHLVHPDIILKPNAGSDRSWTWRTKDFAGDSTEGEEQTFAIRFKDADTANVFRTKWDEYRQTNAKLVVTQ